MNKLFITFLCCIPVNSAFASSHMEPNFGGHTNSELYLSFAVLGFGLITLALQFWVMVRAAKGWGPNAIRITGLTLVIISGLYLITAGYSQEQIAPMMGLLGTIAGYLLGKSEKDS